MGTNEQLPMWVQILIYVVFIWSLFWKGLALWRASHNNQRNWFIVLLIVNSVGILELLYLFRFSKKRLTLREFKHIVTNAFVEKTSEK